MTKISLSKSYDVTDIAVALERGDLSPDVLFEHLLGRIVDLDGKLGAFTQVFGEAGAVAARAAKMARRAGHSVGPLHGVPIAFKDIIDIEGYPTRLGSAARHEAVNASCSADVVKMAIAAGMIALGKTSTVEYAFGGWGLDPQGNSPWNPWDPDVHRIPGGSSSGSAVAVSAGLVPVAIGSDTSGSIRVPASYCGIVGLKTTTACVSRRGVLELSPSLDTVGPLVRSVRDAELMLALMAGANTGALNAILKRNCFQPLPGLVGLRIAIMGNSERANVADDVLENFDASVRTLADMGALIEPIDALPSFVELAGLTKPILMAESYALHGRMADDSNSGVGEVVRAKIRSGAGVSPDAYLKALSQRTRIQNRYQAILSGYDAFLTPTTETTAFPVSQVDESKTPARFVRLANLVDCFALSLPNGMGRTGLPTGLQIMAAGASPRCLFDIGKAYQAAIGWTGETLP